MLKKIREELKKLTDAKALRELHVRSERAPGYVTLRGKKLLDFTNWDSLNLNTEPKFISAFQREAEISGVGATAARSSSGTTPAHFAAEKRLSSFFNSESSLLFSSANQAILSLMSALLTEGDCVIVDEGSHGRIVDAALLVHAESINFDTTNPDSLIKACEISRPYKNKIAIISSVSPISGEVADIKKIITVAEKHQIPLLIDESYSLGILGIRGAGVLDGLEIPVNLLGRFGSLAYSLGAYGGFFSGPKSVTDLLVNRSRTFSSEPSLPPAIAAAVEVGMGIVELGHGKRIRLRELTSHFRDSLIEAGYKIQPTSESNIIALKFPKKSIATELAEGLFHKGILAEVIDTRTPSESSTSLRFIINSAHKEREIEDTLAALSDLSKRIKS